MTRHAFAILAILLTMSLCVGFSGAADQSPADAAVTAEIAVQAPSSEPKSTCTGLGEAPSFLSAPLAHLASAEPSSLSCNCNRPEDCRLICGEEGGSCFIGPVCDNWPDYTGKCMCKKSAVGVN